MTGSELVGGWLFAARTGGRVYIHMVELDRRGVARGVRQRLQGGGWQCTKSCLPLDAKCRFDEAGDRSSGFVCVVVLLHCVEIG